MSWKILGIARLEMGRRPDGPAIDYRFANGVLAIDLQSLGVVLYVLVCGALPFDGGNLQILRDRVLSGRFRIPYFLSVGGLVQQSILLFGINFFFSFLLFCLECESLIRKMLVVDANKRFSLWQVKRHRWMQAEVPAAESAEEEQDTVTTETANEQILRLMQSLGVDPTKTKDSLDHERYDHYAAIYYLLLERRSHLTQATATGQVSDTAPSVARRTQNVNNEVSPTALDPAVTYFPYLVVYNNHVCLLMNESNCSAAVWGWRDR